MNFYDTWLHREALSAPWMLLAVVWTLFALNFLAPAIIWSLLNGRRPFQTLWERLLPKKNAEDRAPPGAGASSDE